MSRGIKIALKLFLAGVLFYWLLTSGRLDFYGLLGIQERWQWVAVAQILFGITQVLIGLRWKLLLGSQGIRYRLRTTFCLTLVGLFFNQVALGSTGGDIYRAYAVAQGAPANRSGAIVSVFVDRAFGLFMLLVLVVAASLINWRLLQSHMELMTFFFITVAIIVATTFVVVCYFSSFVRRRRMVIRLFSILPFQNVLSNVDVAIKAYKHHWRTLRSAAALSLLIQLLIVAMNVCFARALLGDVNWWPFVLLVPAAHLVMAIPVNPPGALGTAEAVYAYLFEMINIGVGSLVAILQRLTTLTWAFAGALIFVIHKGWPALNHQPTAHAGGQ